MFGWSNLKKYIRLPEGQVECPVDGCEKFVPRQSTHFKATADYRCPDHRIFISPSTFEYEDEKENMLWTEDDDIALWKCIKTPGVKRESRLARDNSEDSVTWNVFRFLDKQRLLSEFVNLAAGDAVAVDPHLIYWSFCQNSRKPWELLLEAAKTFGESVARRSEPDLIIEDEKHIVFVESKWTSGNRTSPTNRNNPKMYESGGNGWFRRVFAGDTDFMKVAVEDKLYELMRLWLIGSWIAECSRKKFVLVNLVRADSKTEINIEERFGKHIMSAPNRRFVRLTWEQIYSEIILPQTLLAEQDDAKALAKYLREKTIGYRPSKGINQAILRRALDLPLEA